MYHQSCASRYPQLRNNVNPKIADELPFPLNVIYPHTKGGRHPMPKSGYTLWNNMIAAGKNTTLPAHDGDAHECAAILYSGGTTGTTKGIQLSSMNFNALGLQTIAASGFGKINGMKMLSIMPVFHGFGLGIGIHTALIGGATCILVPQFSVKVYSDTLLKHKAPFPPL